MVCLFVDLLSYVISPLAVDAFTIYLHEVLRKYLPILHSYSLYLPYFVAAGKRDLLLCPGPLSLKCLRPTVTEHLVKVLPKHPNLLEQEARSSTIVKKIALGMVRSVGITQSSKPGCKGKGSKP